MGLHWGYFLMLVWDVLVMAKSDIIYNMLKPNELTKCDNMIGLYVFQPISPKPCARHLTKPQ